jgi:hypothetical protein
MDSSLSLNELLEQALAAGAVQFRMHTGLHPLVFSLKGVQTYDTQCVDYESIDALLRRLLTSRAMRELRTRRQIHFKSMFDGKIPLLGKAEIQGEDIHVELCKMSA